MSTLPKKVITFGKLDGQEVTGNFLLIPAGAFYVGSNVDGGRRLAVITKPFYMQETPVTQEQYQVVTGNNPSKFNKNFWDSPVEQVNWNDAVEFCRKLGPLFRLSTEMEWEWSARGGDGDKYKYAGSNNPDEVARTSKYGTARVKQLEPNGYGLYGMSGNVYEWCSDWYKPYPNQELIDYRGLKGSRRILRGGCWGNDPAVARVALRSRSVPSHAFDHLGFRLVMDIP